MSLTGLRICALEAVERQSGLGKDRRRAVIGAALPRTAVAGEAAIGEEETLAVTGIARRRVLRLRHGRSGSADHSGSARDPRDLFDCIHGRHSSARIGDDIDHGRLAAFDRSDGAGERRARDLWDR